MAPKCTGSFDFALEKDFDFSLEKDFAFEKILRFCLGIVKRIWREITDIAHFFLDKPAANQEEAAIKTIAEVFGFAYFLFIFVSGHRDPY